MGSGTTLLAAERTGRLGYGIELDPIYVDVAVRRWEQMTGQEAVLEDGRSFAEVATERTGDLADDDDEEAELDEPDVALEAPPQPRIRHRTRGHATTL
jgi:hypothetical protein